MAGRSGRGLLSMWRTSQPMNVSRTSGQGGRTTHWRTSRGPFEDTRCSTYESFTRARLISHSATRGPRARVHMFCPRSAIDMRSYFHRSAYSCAVLRSAMGILSERRRQSTLKQPLSIYVAGIGQNNSGAYYAGIKMSRRFQRKAVDSSHKDKFYRHRTCGDKLIR